ncbi:MAG TPA: MaoC/PaaZ C-terminal domain-containing protein [Bacillus sp. (in: firmicutes)]|uniref:MaoC family dehydratase n=1 Tax=Bacillus litorisediminis TaxID=2922713 RepID=UPI001FB00D14|nr:MaoC/PaaZ C-terminal domain-containing protein [Bacillus litorisediminis]HWO75506.1 MaoC/PaaZ C-terminal domain-containing protein [Bacillus sp. (in: firmicutes)]
MLLGKKRKIGRSIEEISVGEKLSLTEKIEDKDLLLYLGLTNDANPLYIQHDYAAQTPYKKPIVPAIMLTGIVMAAVSKHIPGPGSHILKNKMEFQKPVYHYETVHFSFEVKKVEPKEQTVTIAVEGTDEANEPVLTGILVVVPPSAVISSLG